MSNPARKRRNWLAVDAGLAHLDYPDTAAGRKNYWRRPKRLSIIASLPELASTSQRGASLQVTVERGWCFGSEAFREKQSLLVGNTKPDTG